MEMNTTVTPELQIDQLRDLINIAKLYSSTKHLTLYIKIIRRMPRKEAPKDYLNKFQYISAILETFFEFFQIFGSILNICYKTQSNYLSKMLFLTKTLFHYLSLRHYLVSDTDRLKFRVNLILYA